MFHVKHLCAILRVYIEYIDKKGNTLQIVPGMFHVKHY